MKKKFAIVNLSLMLAVLFSILFQSLHSYEHFLDKNNTVVVHQEDDSDKIQTLDHDHQKCFVCEFTLSSFIETSFFSFQSQIPYQAVAYNFRTIEASEFFSGSSFSLRGPPSNC